MTAALPASFSHIGLHIGDLDRALDYLVNGLQLPLLARGAETDPLLALMVGTPTPVFQTARVQLPGTEACIRLVENRGAPEVDNRHQNPGTCHFAYYTHDLRKSWAELEAAGSTLISSSISPVVGGLFDGGLTMYCTGHDGYPVELMQGRAYLDGTPRDPDAVPSRARANETCHLGIQVRDRDRSLAFYRDLLGMASLHEWLEDSPRTQSVVGLPGSELNMAILRLPGTPAYVEVIEYQKVPWTPADTDNRNNRTFHLAYRVPDLDATQSRLAAFGSRILGSGILRGPDGSRALCCEDPDGIRVVFTEPCA